MKQYNKSFSIFLGMASGIGYYIVSLTTGRILPLFPFPDFISFLIGNLIVFAFLGGLIGSIFNYHFLNNK